MALSRVKVWGVEVLTATDLNAEIDNILNNAASLISPLGGSLDWDGYAHTLDAAGVTTAQSTASIGWTFTPGNKTGTPATTGGISNWAASTWTDNATAGSGTATAWTGHSFQRPTLASSNSSVTTTDAATVYVANSPLAGSNETLTNAWALWIDAGNVRFDDNIYWRSGTSFAGIFDHANAADRTYTFPDATGNIPTVATQSEVNSMTSTATAISPNHNRIFLETLVTAATGSPTAINFTSIPSGVRRITVMFNAVSTNGTSDWVIRLGDSGGVESTGYQSTNGLLQASPAFATYTNGLGVNGGPVAAGVYSGQAILTLMDAATFQWTFSSTLCREGSSVLFIGAGQKATSALLDRIQITTIGGTDTFDNGFINVAYER